MAKQLPDLNEILPNFVSDGDYMLIRDTSAREDKKIKVGDLVSMVFLLSHAIGSTYTTYAETDDPNRFGGSWELAAKGRSIIGVDPADPDFSSADMTGGAKTHGHSLSSGGYAKIGTDTSSTYFGSLETSVTEWGATRRLSASAPVTATSTRYTVGASLGGSTDSTSSLHPYETAYIWRRVA